MMVGEMKSEEFKCVVILPVISCSPEHPLIILLISQNICEVVVHNPCYHF